jgi:hypothetical protein
MIRTFAYLKDEVARHLESDFSLQRLWPKKGKTGSKTLTLIFNEVNVGPTKIK